jgi:N-glycosidase YbiA
MTERTQEYQLPIKFYSVTDQYGFMSNFAEYAFSLDGKKWRTSEHYFQAKKFDDAAYVELVRSQNTPALAAKMGRNRKVKIRRDWESIKNDVMYRAVRAKFEQNLDIAQMLLETGTAKLIEHADNDDYWGDGGDGSGQNMLGRILMRVRDELRV